MVDKRRPFRRSHRRLVWIGGVLLALLVVAAVCVSVALHHAEPFLRARIVTELEERFHSRVELDSFHVSVMNGLWAEGKGLRIWPPAPADGAVSGPPLIRLAEFRFHAPLHYEPGQPIYISQMTLDGLDVDVPPKTRLERAHDHGSSQRSRGPVRFKVGTIECTDARLTLETDSPGKAPLVFAIAHLKLTGVGEGRSTMGFAAELTNPRPVGTIHTHGRFGPWQVKDPGETPLAGSYRFEHANLAAFKGIAGTLNSTGNYQGTLRNMIVEGRTDTPDFRLSSGEAMPLRTRFRAIVDGVNGDTRLEPVDALLGHSHLTARGEIVHVAAKAASEGQSARPGGHDIALNVSVERGRIEDFLRLATRGEPLLKGALTMRTSLEVPPGKQRIADKLRLKGNFLLDDAQFTNAKMQSHVDELSMRGQGKPHDAKSAAAGVRSTMQSDFQMADGVISLPNLRYAVPGAEIDLKGTYGVEGGKLNFAGTAKMHATVSQMVGGWKGLLLTPLDRLFEQGGTGTVVPVVIGGTRKDPQFTVDFGRFKKTVPQRPGGAAGQ